MVVGEGDVVDVVPVGAFVVLVDERVVGTGVPVFGRYLMPEAGQSEVEPTGGC